MASIKKRPENRTSPWTVRWREDGHNRRKSFQHKEQAYYFLANTATPAEQAEKAGQPISPAEMSRRTLGRQYREWSDSRQHLSRSVRDKDASVWRRWLEPELGNRRLGTLTHHDLNRLLAKVTQSGSGPDTRISVYSRLCMILDDALGPDQHSCRRAVAGTSKRKRKIRPLEDDELDRLLEEMIHPRDYDLADTLATLGLRPGEALALTGRDVRNNEMTVHASKTGRLRHLPIPTRLASRLDTRARAVGDDALLFGVRDLRNWRRRVFTPAARRAGLEGVVPYDLRHTAASRLIANSASPTDVAEWLGHSPEMTLRVYSHLFKGRKSELAQMLDR